MPKSEIKKYLSEEEAYQEIVQFLQDGVTDPRHPMHHMVLGTLGKGVPQLRTVIFRRFIEEDWRLICHSDVRADKVSEVRENSRVSLLFYHPAAKIQLRLIGEAIAHTDDALANEQWANTKLMGRRCYSAPFAPGVAVERDEPNLPAQFIKRNPNWEESEIGRPNFCVIATKITEIDWLYLRAKGNQRIRFLPSGGGWKGEWITA